MNWTSIFCTCLCPPCVTYSYLHKCAHYYVYMFCHNIYRGMNLFSANRAPSSFIPTQFGGWESAKWVEGTSNKKYSIRSVDAANRNWTFGQSYQWKIVRMCHWCCTCRICILLPNFIVVGLEATRKNCSTCHSDPSCSVCTKMSMHKTDSNMKLVGTCCFSMAAAQVAAARNQRCVPW